jgi:hypothetical protein
MFSATFIISNSFLLFCPNLTTIFIEHFKSPFSLYPGGTPPVFIEELRNEKAKLGDPVSLSCRGIIKQPHNFYSVLID